MKREEGSNGGERERDSKEREKRRREGREAVKRTGRWKVRKREKVESGLLECSGG